MSLSRLLTHLARFFHQMGFKFGYLGRYICPHRNEKTFNYHSDKPTHMICDDCGMARGINDDRR